VVSRINIILTLAQETNLSKSSIHRLYHRIIKRNQYPESELWETEEGQKWLRLLVLATIFIFALAQAEGLPVVEDDDLRIRAGWDWLRKTLRVLSFTALTASHWSFTDSITQLTRSNGINNY